MARLSIRIDLESGARIGPGKIRLLEEIARTGSISAAGRALNMSYRRAWGLVEQMNQATGAIVVATAAGGSGGGGARVTPAGETLIASYRDLEQAAAAAGREALARLAQLSAEAP